MKKPTRQRKQRIAVTLTDLATPVVAEVARLSKRPQSAVIAELVDVAIPSLEATAKALKVVEEHPKEAELILARFASAGLAQLSQAQLDFAQFVDGKTVLGRRRKRARGA